MQLWIRSQDKELLTRVVDIWKDADKNEIWSKSSFIAKDTNSLIACINAIGKDKLNGLNYPYQMPEK